HGFHAGEPRRRNGRLMAGFGQQHYLFVRIVAQPPAYLFLAAASMTTFTAALRSGLDCDMSRPMPAIFSMIDACSAAGRLISSPPVSVQALRCAAKNSVVKGG